MSGAVRYERRLQMMNAARDLAAQDVNASAYKTYLGDVYRSAERRTRAQKRDQRGCLTNDWCPAHLAGKTVLVIREDGVGDEILTVGCLSNLVTACASASWKCNPKLQVLFTRSFPGVAFVSDENPPPAAECRIYSWELVGRFRQELADFPWAQSGSDFEPYLKPRPSLVNRLAARYGQSSKMVIGLAWRSEREGELLSDKTCDIREVPLWEGLFERLKDKLRFVSLQYGDTRSDIDFVRWKYGVEIYQDDHIDIFNDVDAAAAQVAAMDYIVSISTTAAHLAGALGVPGWVLLPAKPFGHWRAGKTISPWYPTLRPIRQDAPGDWRPVLEKVASELETEIKST